MNAWGPVRGVVAVLAAGAMVWGAADTTRTVDATRRSDVRSAFVDTTSSRLASTMLTCTGSDTAGTVTAASMPARWLPDAGSGGSVTARGTTSGVSLRRGGTAQAGLPSASAGEIAGSGGLAGGLAATQSGLDRRQAARGLLVSACSPPVQDGWFFGGGDQKGRVVRLALVNPATTPVTVTASVVGAAGVDHAVSVEGTVLAPGARKVLTLGDFGASLSAAAIHVTASGAGVAVSLTDSWMTGETPVGEDTVASAASPARELVVPGVVAGPVAPVVRLAVPGKQQAIVRVRAVDTSGAVLADQVTTVAAGTAQAMTLTGLRTGSYSVQVTADVPVVGAVLARTAPTGTSDLSWATAAPGLSAPAGLALPNGIPDGAAQLMLAADQRVTVQLTTVAPGGQDSTRSLVVPGDRPVTAALGDASAVWVRPQGKGAVHASVTFTGHDRTGDFLATVPIDPLLLDQATSRLIPARG